MPTAAAALDEPQFTSRNKRGAAVDKPSTIGVKRMEEDAANVLSFMASNGLVANANKSEVDETSASAPYHLLWRLAAVHEGLVYFCTSCTAAFPQ